MVHGIHQQSLNHLEGKKQNGGNNLYFILGGLYMSSYILSCPSKQGAPKCVPIVGSVDAPGSVRSQGVSLSCQGRVVVVSVTNPPHSCPTSPLTEWQFFPCERQSIQT